MIVKTGTTFFVDKWHPYYIDGKNLYLIMNTTKETPDVSKIVSDQKFYR